MTIFPGGAISYNDSSISEVAHLGNLGEATNGGETRYAVLSAFTANLH